jgi:flagellar biogenesis protein FliO
MSTTAVPRLRSKPGYWAPWMTLGGIALVAITAGLLLPQLLPGEADLDKSRPSAETKAKGKTDYAGPVLPDMPSPQGLLTRLASGTMLVLGLAVAAIWGLRRWQQAQAPAATAPRHLQLLETLPLGNRCSLHLVHTGQCDILIGVDGAGIKNMLTLPKPFEEIMAEAEAPAADAAPSPQADAA